MSADAGRREIPRLSTPQSALVGWLSQGGAYVRCRACFIDGKLIQVARVSPPMRPNPRLQTIKSLIRLGVLIDVPSPRGYRDMTLSDLGRRVAEAEGGKP